MKHKMGNGGFPQTEPQVRRPGAPCVPRIGGITRVIYFWGLFL